MMRALILLAALVLAGCNDSRRPPPLNAAAVWTAQYSRGIILFTSPGTLVQFVFPVYAKPSIQCASDLTCGSVHYIVKASNSLGGTLVARGRIETAGEPTFQFALNPNNTCPGPATMRLYMQRRGDNMTASMAGYRWWSIPLVLAPGAFELAVPLDATRWIDVNGHSGDQAAFNAARADLQAVGLAFGGGCFAGHGVNIDQGSAIFTLTEFGAR